ncbi:hypothetical protein P7K49_023713 [Saguinus oedipus]|uniref:Uncharacterized protein n=1 Tax=Saguinus oedipus TaxID=9490 RepID=A0ABQ9UMF2_SAGOE|nr:hypothetical protein P7K49_023713 [Saguinus oedipus]
MPKPGPRGVVICDQHSASISGSPSVGSLLLAARGRSPQATSLYCAQGLQDTQHWAVLSVVRPRLSYSHRRSSLVCG